MMSSRLSHYLRDGLGGDVRFPADPVVAVYCLAAILATLLATRAFRRAVDRSRRFAAAEAAAIQSDRLAQLIGALAAARTPAAAAEAALLEPLQALQAPAGLLVLVNRDGLPGEVVHSVGYAPDD